MYQITVIESAKELLKLTDDLRQEGDKMPYMGRAKLVIENNYSHLQLQGNSSYELSEKVKFEDLVKILFDEANIDIHIT